jgi:hypothetical protein
MAKIILSLQFLRSPVWWLYIQCLIIIDFINGHVNVTSRTCCVHLTFIGSCIVIYSYSKTNKMQLFLKLFILVKHSAYFRWSCRPSSGNQDCTYCNRHMSNRCCYLLLAGMRWNISSLLAAGSSICLTYACCYTCNP